MSPIFSRILGLVHAEDFQLAVIVAPKHVKNIEQINQSTLIHKTKQNKTNKNQENRSPRRKQGSKHWINFFCLFSLRHVEWSLGNSPKELRKLITSTAKHGQGAVWFFFYLSLSYRDKAWRDFWDLTVLQSGNDVPPASLRKPFHQQKSPAGRRQTNFSKVLN